MVGRDKRRMSIAPDFTENSQSEHDGMMKPKEGPYKCKKCDSSFMEKEHLEMHMKKKHGNH